MKMQAHENKLNQPIVYLLSISPRKFLASLNKDAQLIGINNKNSFILYFCKELIKRKELTYLSQLTYQNVRYDCEFHLK